MKEGETVKSFYDRGTAKCRKVDLADGETLVIFSNGLKPELRDLSYSEIRKN